MLTVFYDGDCDVCRCFAALLRRLDRARRLRLLPLQTAAAYTPSAPAREELAATLHVVDASGRWTVGGAALVRIGQALSLLRPLATLAELPFLRPVVETFYALVARNRHRIGRLLRLNGCNYRGDPTPAIPGSSQLHSIDRPRVHRDIGLARAALASLTRPAQSLRLR